MLCILFLCCSQVFITTHFANVLQQIDIYDVATGNIATENIGNEKAGINNHDYVWAWVLVCAYAAYIAVLIAGWMRSVFRMIRFLKGRRYYRLGRGIRLYRTDIEMGPFSWMNCIVIFSYSSLVPLRGLHHLLFEKV